MFKYVLFVCFFLFPILIKAQEKHQFKNHYFWFNSGMGKSASEFGNYINIGVGGTYLFKNIYAINYQKLLLSSIPTSEHSWKEFKSDIIAIGINKSFKKRHSLLFSAGPSLNEGLYLGKNIKPVKIDTTYNPGFINLDFTPTKRSDFEQSKINYYGVYLSLEYLHRTNHLAYSFRYYFNFSKYFNHGLVINFNIGYLNND